MCIYNGGNRLNGVFYDQADNQLMVNGNRLGYDAENRQVSVTSPASTGGGTESYAYDGNGNRVQKAGTGGLTVYVYDAFGLLAAEYAATVTGAPLCQTCYLSADHLGSVRLVMDQTGTVVSRHDYLPFGEEIGAGQAGRTGPFGASDNVNQRFTGQERDPETGLDYFGTRYYGSALGRFTSPDPLNAGADPADPQSWNAYAYTGNNPLTRTDPNGLDYHVCIDNGNGGQQCTNVAYDTTFQSVLKNPGVGISTAGDRSGGTIYSTDQNGNQMQVGTYEHFVGPGTEGGGIREDGFFEGLLLGVGRGLFALGAVAVEDLAGSIRNVNPTRGTENCVNCAIATDATLAGRPASAMPSGVTPINVLEQQFGGRFVRAGSEQAIEQTMQSAGPDARGIVFGERGGDIGHVFNVMNQNGVVRFLDGQTGQPASLSGYTGFRLLRTR